MSLTTLNEAKQFLKVTHSDDDDTLQRLLDGAEAEALNFMDREQFGELCPCDSNFETESAHMTADVKTSVLLLVQADYEAPPIDAKALRDLAHAKLQPYRCRWGV